MPSVGQGTTWIQVDQAEHIVVYSGVEAVQAILYRSLKGNKRKEGPSGQPKRKQSPPQSLCLSRDP